MKKLIILITALCHQAAYAAFWDGNDLYKWLSNPNQRTQAVMFVSGVSDAEEESVVETAYDVLKRGGKSSRVFLCIPDNVTIGQATDVVKLYLEKNPKIRHYRAAFLVRSALYEAWPCISPDAK